MDGRDQIRLSAGVYLCNRESVWLSLPLCSGAHKRWAGLVQSFKPWSAACLAEPKHCTLLCFSALLTIMLLKETPQWCHRWTVFRLGSWNINLFLTFFSVCWLCFTLQGINERCCCVCYQVTYGTIQPKNNLLATFNSFNHPINLIYLVVLEIHLHFQIYSYVLHMLEL